MGLVTLKGYATLFLFAHFLIVTLVSITETLLLSWFVIYANGAASALAAANAERMIASRMDNNNRVSPLKITHSGLFMTFLLRSNLSLRSPAAGSRVCFFPTDWSIITFNHFYD